MSVNRALIEGSPRLDVRALARAGALRPGTVGHVTWGGQAAIITVVTSEAPDQLRLRYAVPRLDDRVEEVEEHVSLTTTPSTFGGRRVWFRCPGCKTRCAMLYGFGGRFRCRACHALAYQSTRIGDPR